MLSDVLGLSQLVHLIPPLVSGPFRSCVSSWVHS